MLDSWVLGNAEHAHSESGIPGKRVGYTGILLKPGDTWPDQQQEAAASPGQLGGDGHVGEDLGAVGSSCRLSVRAETWRSILGVLASPWLEGSTQGRASTGEGEAGEGQVLLRPGF